MARSLFAKTFEYYRHSKRGVLYMPLRWLIVPFGEIEMHFPKVGKIIELGCGEGVISTYLALGSKKRTVIGIDTDKNKIDLANASTKQLRNISFEQSDALEGIRQSDGILLSDFLHHLPRQRQDMLLGEIYKSIKSGGVLIIKEIDLNDFVRSKVSRIFDYIFYPKDKITFLKADSLSKKLTKLGFKVTVKKEKKLFPGSTTLFICKKDIAK